MKTRDRILAAALELFNQKGERKVTTNHIASHLEMSPGNLYYHFKNKQEITYELILNYTQSVASNLDLPLNRPLTIADQFNYMETIFEGMWAYRFIHRDRERLQEGEERLHVLKRHFFSHSLKKTEAIYQALNTANIINIKPKEVEGLALNTWILVDYWFSFLQCNVLIKHNDSITPDMVKGGIYQVIQLMRPYLSDEYRHSVELMEVTYTPKTDWLKLE